MASNRIDEAADQLREAWENDSPVPSFKSNIAHRRLRRELLTKWPDLYKAIQAVLEEAAK